jgi:hypothetical protein
MLLVNYTADGPVSSWSFHCNTPNQTEDNRLKAAVLILILSVKIKDRNLFMVDNARNKT